MRVREKSVSLVIVAPCIVLEIRPEGLPDGMRVGEGGVGRETQNERSASGLSNWPHGPACRVMEERGLGEEHFERRESKNQQLSPDMIT